MNGSFGHLGTLVFDDSLRVFGTHANTGSLHSIGTLRAVTHFRVTILLSLTVLLHLKGLSIDSGSLPRFGTRVRYWFDYAIGYHQFHCLTRTS